MNELKGGGITARQRYLNRDGWDKTSGNDEKSNKAILENLSIIQSADNEKELIERYNAKTEEKKKQGQREIDEEYHERKASLDEFTEYGD